MATNSAKRSRNKSNAKLNAAPKTKVLSGTSRRTQSKNTPIIVTSALSRLKSALGSIVARAKESISRGLGFGKSAPKKITVLRTPLKLSDQLTVLRGPKDVDSSWVDSIAYIRYGGRNGVAIKFLSGAECFYPFTSVKDYAYIRDAKSKGKAVWRRFYYLPYELLN